MGLGDPLVSVLDVFLTVLQDMKTADEARHHRRCKTHNVAMTTVEKIFISCPVFHSQDH